MKTFLILSAVFACIFAAPTVSVIESPLLVHAAPVVSPFAHPLLAQVEGEAPASTVHATHVKQVLVPQVISSYSLPTLASTHVISAYGLPAPIVS
jgi:hypothetical protein